MLKTTNYQLNKIELTDSPPDITVLNQNFDTIDTNLYKANRTLGFMNSIPVTTSTVANAYLVQISGFDATNDIGKIFTIKFHAGSTNAWCSLNINGTGVYPIVITETDNEMFDKVIVGNSCQLILWTGSRYMLLCSNYFASSATII